MLTNKKMVTNKKAVAEVVTMIALTAITIGAVILAMSSITNVISQKANFQASPAYSCLELTRNAIPGFQVLSACESDTNIEVKVRRGFEDRALGTIVFTLGDQTRTCGLACGTECTQPDAGKTKTYFFDKSEFTELITSVEVHIDSCRISSVSVRPCI